jgi:heme O synthase-like polyprenyltransferase
MSLAVFTAFVGLAIAPGHLDPVLASVAIGAIAVGAGAAGVLNMWCDADIDAVMARTARRPIPRGEISRAEALVFGLILLCSAVAIRALVLNIKAAVLLAFAISLYVVVYTMWLLLPISLLPCAPGFAGPLFGTAAATCGAILVALAFQLHGSKATNRLAAQRLFSFSILYLFALFAALLAGNLGNRWSSTLLPRAEATLISSSQREMPAGLFGNAYNSISLNADKS